jgi:hypothetical protein
VQCNKITQDMWDDYLHVCEERGIGDDTDESLTICMMRRRIELVHSYCMKLQITKLLQVGDRERLQI